jgi:hypothetical protein
LFLFSEGPDLLAHLPWRSFFERICSEGFRREVFPVSGVDVKIGAVVWTFRAVLSARLPLILISLVSYGSAHQNGAARMAMAVGFGGWLLMRLNELATARDHVAELLRIAVSKLGD